MSVKVIVPPEPIVDMDTAKAHLRVDGTYDDAYIEALIAAATGWIDGPGGGWLGRALGRQTLEMSLCSWGSGPICLPYPPVISVEDARYLDASDVYVSVPPEAYEYIAGVGLAPRPGHSWPSVNEGAAAVQVEYVAGYDGAVPPPIIIAILMLVAQWYGSREAVNVGNIVNEMPFAVEALLSPYRVWS